MAESTGVTVADMQEYLRVDGDEKIIQNLITVSENAIMNAIEPKYKVDEYRKLPQFNQAVRVLVDYQYFSRGLLSSQTVQWPESVKMLVNSFRWQVIRAYGNQQQTDTG
ncbi:head-tail connector protein [Lactobacillus sp. ESL0677]|uniref:head-tail connector protein n=1 Tax=Lactobacillus sp. ESL0677 TaxID=2983208 RepID=UPI0023F82E4D|nr:head-tail connector protein [Lactobacillus sp. ESL0677]WEV36219.1 head-tail connector protein [Lactobacillus sp. ESL0677]